jgi:hypothetical protein
MVVTPLSSWHPPRRRNTPSGPSSSPFHPRFKANKSKSLQNRVWSTYGTSLSIEPLFLRSSFEVEETVDTPILHDHSINREFLPQSSWHTYITKSSANHWVHIIMSLFHLSSSRELARLRLLQFYSTFVSQFFDVSGRKFLSTVNTNLTHIGRQRIAEMFHIYSRFFSRHTKCLEPRVTTMSIDEISQTLFPFMVLCDRWLVLDHVTGFTVL